MSEKNINEILSKLKDILNEFHSGKYQEATLDYCIDCLDIAKGNCFENGHTVVHSCVDHSGLSEWVRCIDWLKEKGFLKEVEKKPEEAIEISVPEVSVPKESFLIGVETIDFNMINRLIESLPDEFGKSMFKDFFALAKVLMSTKDPKEMTPEELIDYIRTFLLSLRYLFSIFINNLNIFEVSVINTLEEKVKKRE